MEFQQNSQSKLKYLLVPFGIIILMCLGTVYSWSVFRAPLTQELNLSSTTSLLPYAVALLFFASFMPISGYYMNVVGSRILLFIGGISIIIGYVLASYARSAFMLVISYGLINGVGVGIAYGVPLAVVAAWFPKSKGLAVGTTVIGFGLSPLVTAPLANYLIHEYGVRSTLRILGLTFGIIIICLSTLYKMPPKENLNNSNSQDKNTSDISSDKSVNEENILSNPIFYGLWVCYAIATFIGLSCIGISSTVGHDLIGLSKSEAAKSVSLFSIFNGISRPIMGWVSDKFSPKKVITFVYLLVILASIVMIDAGHGNTTKYTIAFSIIWFTLGSWLAIAPTLTLRYFNPQNYSKNYGFLYTAYGVGALIGTTTTGYIYDYYKSYNPYFYMLIFLACLGIVICYKTFTIDPKH